MYACCNEENENYGIIDSELSIDGFYIMTYDCMNLPDTACIRDSSAYLQVFKISPNGDGCGSINLPPVDFSKHSILINHYEDWGKLFFQRTVTVDSINKVVTYKITKSSCKTIVETQTDSYNIVLTNKIGEDYKVVFK